VKNGPDLFRLFAEELRNLRQLLRKVVGQAVTQRQNETLFRREYRHLQQELFAQRLLFELTLDRRDHRLLDHVDELRLAVARDFRIQGKVFVADLKELIDLLFIDTEIDRELRVRWCSILLVMNRRHHLLEPIHHVCSFRRNAKSTTLLGERMKNRLPDPPDGVGDEFDVLLRIEFLRRLHQPDVAFVDEVQKGDVRIAEALRVRNDETEIRFDQLFERDFVVLLRATREIALLFRSQPRYFRNLLQILIQEIARLFAILVCSHSALTRLCVAKLYREAHNSRAQKITQFRSLA
jgi:hypothetical protein